jgi:PEGA domain
MCSRLTMILPTLCSIALGTLLYAESPALAELRFEAKGNAEKTAGVWIDGQYVGYVKEVNSGTKMSLLPGKHEIVVRQAWYKDFDEQVILEPGEVHIIKLSLLKEAHIPARDATGELKIAATPARAAVFVDEQFAGHVDEFDGIGKAMLLVPGSHRVRIALPGYLPFETVVELRPHQKLKIETALLKGSITDAGALVSKD